MPLCPGAAGAARADESAASAMPAWLKNAGSEADEEGGSKGEAGDGRAS